GNLLAQKNYPEFHIGQDHPEKELDIDMTGVSLKGDVDQNGIVNMADAFLLYRAVSGQVTLTVKQEALGDMDQSGTVNMADAFALYRKVSGTT
ncbi:MAG: dockerin type I repeat-containing protein, partial [Clostridia bacterium]|nr:dockerin type I repeat-containing protein [Clostridia bacterium]